MKIYENSRKEEAPHSYQTHMYYLSLYVLPFFLGIKKCTNPSNWFKFFEDFRDYLRSCESIRSTKNEATLSYSTMNGVMKALNSFLLTLHRRNLVRYPFKCRLYHKSKCFSKGAEAVIPISEQIRIREELNSLDRLSADFFYVCLHTGLRINEALGLSVADLFQGTLHSEALRQMLAAHSLKTHGYIVLESQPANRRHLRDPNGQVPRKPLKGKHLISPANSRTIPVFDNECFNILARLWNEQRHLFESREFGDNPRDYLLFRGLNRDRYSSSLRDAQASESTKAQYTPHDTRHTYSTWLAEQTAGNFNICRMVLGHSSISTTLTYVHMGEKFSREIKSKLQLERPMMLVPTLPKGQLLQFKAKTVGGII